MDMVALHDKYEKLRPHLNERTRRLLAAADAEFLGRGGVALVARAANLSRPTLYKAMAELKDGKPNPERVRRNGVRQFRVREASMGVTFRSGDVAAAGGCVSERRWPAWLPVRRMRQLSGSGGK